MKIKKLCNTVAVVLTFCAYSIAAFADCPTARAPSDISADIKLLANNVRCSAVLDDVPALLWAGPALWQKSGKKEDGCEVHASLTKLLYAPAQVKNNNGKGNAVPNNGDSRGAARAVDDGQYEYAYVLLDEYIYNSTMVAKPADDLADSNIVTFAERAGTLRDDVDALLCVP